MKRRAFLAMAAGAAALLPGWSAPPDLAAAAEPPAAPPTDAGETLYNGIRLPAPWPPKLPAPPDGAQPPPYLKFPPAVIDIDLGRQLFVDDFLIEQTTLTRTFHRPTPHKASPVLRPETDWEREGPAPMAMPFSDGVWYDPRDKLFKLFYMGGYSRNVCLATSDDGLTWIRPNLGVRPGTNVVHAGPRDSATVWLDHDDPDPSRRFKLWRCHSAPRKDGAGKDVKGFGLTLHFSADGVHWSEPALRTGSTGDRTTVFYNPFRKRWAYSVRHGWGQPRKRRYWETADLLNGPQWKELVDVPWWLAADARDLPRDDYKIAPQLYNVDCVAYESVMLGLFAIWKGDPGTTPGRPKVNELWPAFSRDGFYFDRPADRSAPFIGVSETRGDWNWGNVQSAGGCCLVVGDELWFYHSGRAGAPGGKGSKDGGGSTGLSILRRDGFTSMDAADAAGTLTTRPVRFTGQHLFVNLAAPHGELTAEVLGDDGRPLPGLGAADCVPPKDVDKTRIAVTWKNPDALAAAANKPVRLRFTLRAASLYAFWLAKDPAGASAGYVAAGGPGYAGNRDA